MLTVFNTQGGILKTVSLTEPLKGYWLRLIDPDEQEIEQAVAATGVPEKFLRFAFEEDDCPRIIRGKNCLLIIVNVPIHPAADQYNTTPLSIILTAELNITVSREETPVLPDSDEFGSETFNTVRRSRFVFQLLYRTSSLFLKNIHQIRQRTDETEIVLRKSTDNQEVFVLLDLEKGLTYFTAALRANLMVVETLFRMRTDPQLHALLETEREEDILETVIIENKRALDLVQTYSDILSSMMDAFSSVIANNLNHMLKFLASITILVSVPTMISSFWSMSLNVPWQGTEVGFWLVVFIALSASALVGVVLFRRRMF
ncbi:MAG TPA: magnesium transporter CorA family protein [Patescibacteria group bacterium]|nr:magnesium transporter CorA family protein [Patescibacteria group bacterium]